MHLTKDASSKMNLSLRYRVGNLLFHPALRIIEHPSGDRLRLRPKENDVFVMLCQSYPGIVPRGDIEREIWGSGVIVTDNSMNQVIKELRKSLNDRENNLIQTVPRMGYVLNVAPAIEEDITPPLSEGQTLTTENALHAPYSLRRDIRFWGGMAGLALIFLAAYEFLTDYYSIHIHDVGQDELPIYSDVTPDKLSPRDKSRITAQTFFIKERSNAVVLCDRYKDGIECR